MSRLNVEGVYSTNWLASREIARVSSNQVLMVVGVISDSIKISTLAQMSSGEFIVEGTPFL